MKPATIDTAVTPLKAFYRRAIIRGEATVNPFVGIMKPAVRCEVRDVVEPVLAAAMLDALPAEDRRLWALAFYGGLRRGEIIGLDPPRDVDLANGVLHIRRGWDMLDGEVEPKSRKGKRRVPIPALLRDHLDAVDGPLGEPNWIARTNVRAAKTWKAAGLPTITLQRGALHVRELHDRRRRQRQGPLNLHGARKHRHHARPLWAHVPRVRGRGSGPARRLPGACRRCANRRALRTRPALSAFTQTYHI
jgi:integrase